MDWNVFGHEWAATLLQQHIARGEVRHAYLFTGPPGIGRRTLAMRFAQALNCQETLTLGEPCGKCRMCTQIERLQQADLTVVQAETVGGTLKVDQVRGLQRSLSLAPYEAKYRVAMLLRFEEANASAQNALLKTLEEAPAKAILLLTADSAENLLPTIVSRCEVLRLRALPLKQLEDALQNQWEIPSEEARLLSHLSGGRTGRAIFLHNHPDVVAYRQELVEDLIRLLGASRRARIAYADPFKKKSRDEIREIYQAWLTLWRDVMLTAAGSSVPLVNLDRADQIERVAGAVGFQTARDCTVNLEQGLARLDQNLNKQLLTEVILMDWPKLI